MVYIRGPTQGLHLKVKMIYGPQIGGRNGFAGPQFIEESSQGSQLLLGKSDQHQFYLRSISSEEKCFIKIYLHFEQFFISNIDYSTYTYSDRQKMASSITDYT